MITAGLLVLTTVGVVAAGRLLTVPRHVMRAQTRNAPSTAWIPKWTLAIFGVAEIGLLAAWLAYAARLSDGQLESLRSTLSVLAAAEATLLGFFLAVLAIFANQTWTQLQALSAARRGLLERATALDFGAAVRELCALYRERLGTAGALGPDYRFPGMTSYTDREVVSDLEMLAAALPGAGGAAGSRRTVAIGTIDLFRVMHSVLLSPLVERTLGDDAAVRAMSDDLRQILVGHDAVAIVNYAHEVRHGGRRFALPILLTLSALWLATVVVMMGSFDPTWRPLYIVVSTFPFAFAWAVAYYFFQLIRVLIAR